MNKYIKKDQFGFAFYDELPAGFRLALQEDIGSLFLRVGSAFLLFNNSAKFECYTMRGMPIEIIENYIHNKMLFLYDPANL